MISNGIGRMAAAAAIAGTALLVAGDVGGPIWAALLGLVAGALATLLAWRGDLFAQESGPPAAAPLAAVDGAREVMAALDDPMLLLRAGRIEVANPAARELLGDWIEGRDVRLALRHPATVERLAGAVAGAGRAEPFEVVGIGEAERRWLVGLSPLDEGRALVRLSDRSAAAAAERMRVDFVANASHELRTPLATILGFIETLRDDEAGGEPALRNRFLGIMQDEGRRMQQLIEDLMSLSRIEAERFSPPSELVDLVPLIEEVRVGCRQMLDERRNRLVVENEAGAALVPGDRAQLLQLVRNLVANAVKYGREDSEVTVRLAEEDPATIRLTVSDRGDGIAAEHLPRLTERFYRIDAGRSRAVGGTGLGLAIVKHIVTRHRGRLDIRSAPGEGTFVHVLLPRTGPLS